MEIELPKITAEDLQFVQSRQIAITEIVRIFCLPQDVFIDVSRVPSTNLKSKPQERGSNEPP